MIDWSVFKGTGYSLIPRWIFDENLHTSFFSPIQIKYVIKNITSCATLKDNWGRNFRHLLKIVVSGTFQSFGQTSLTFWFPKNNTSGFVRIIGISSLQKYALNFSMFINSLEIIHFYKILMILEKNPAFLAIYSSNFKKKSLVICS